MKSLKTNIFLLVVSLIFSTTWAQKIDLPKQPMASVDIAALYIPQTIITAAKQMPEEYYSFRPTPDVRSFGELMAHIAESNFEMTAIAKGESPPVTKVNPTKTEIIKALETSFDYAAKTRTEMTKEQKETLVQFMGAKQPAGNVLDFSVFHSLQHYGNVIVYIRLKGLIPPSSQ